MNITQQAVIDAFFTTDIDGPFWVCAHCANNYPDNYTHILYVPTHERYEAFCGYCHYAIADSASA